MRILSRERGGLETLITDPLLVVLVAQARLKPLTEEDERGGDPETLAIAEEETKGMFLNPVNLNNCLMTSREYNSVKVALGRWVLM